jgi:hypothetical protein
VKRALIATMIVLRASPIFAHRLDEYLEATVLTVEKNRVQAEMMLTPGVAVFPIVMSAIDVNRDGAVSEKEQRAYAVRVLRDLTISIDGEQLTPRLVSTQFPSVEEMKDGRGEIQIDFSADLPPGGRNRRLAIENRHQSPIAAYQVNCLVPRDPRIRITAQNRNFSQSRYELDYEQMDAESQPLSLGLWTDRLIWLSPMMLLLLIRLGVGKRYGR